MKNELPIHYTFRRCPYAMRARLAIYVSKFPYEHREIVLRAKPEHMLEISPKGTVPVLQLVDGTVLEESLDIMHHVLNINDPENWLSHQEEAGELIAENDGSFKKVLDRYKYPNRYPDEDPSINWRDEGCKFLAKLDGLLQENKYLYRSTPCVADMAIFPFIRQFANTDRKWWDGECPYTNVKRWLETHLESELFQQIMPKYEPWHEGDKPLLCNV